MEEGGGGGSIFGHHHHRRGCRWSLIPPLTAPEAVMAGMEAPHHLLLPSIQQQPPYDFGEWKEEGGGGGLISAITATNEVTDGH